jgi:hypothetical protein
MENQMSKRSKASMIAIVVCLGMFLAAPAIAQSPMGATTQDATSQHHQRLYQMMKDMTREMGAMTEQMSRSELSPEQRAQMGRRMGLMSAMMRRMSGLAARPAMKEAEWQKQMDQMRKQMDELMGASSMKPGAK